jgi:hypothetical protein
VDDGNLGVLCEVAIECDKPTIGDQFTESAPTPNGVILWRLEPSAFTTKRALPLSGFDLLKAPKAI